MLEFFNWVVLQFKENQFLVGISLPVALGIIGYICKSIPYTIYSYIKKLLTLEFTITTNVENYDKILKHLFNHRFKLFSRTYALNNSGEYLTPGYGWSVGYYKGTFFTFNRFILDGKMHIEEETKITFFTKNLNFINILIEDIKSSQDLNKINIYKNNGRANWSFLGYKNKRLKSTVFINDEIVDKIIDEINDFYVNENRYIELGIPYKKCILMYGPPGTGKTSIIHSVCSELNKNIKIINSLDHISETLSNNDGVFIGDNYVKNEINKDIYVIEDIDCLIKENREQENKNIKLEDVFELAPENLSQSQMLHQLLNNLDGFLTPHGLVIFITTNHLDKLDPALLRKGRIDNIYLIDKLNYEEMNKMYYKFYSKNVGISKEEYTPLVGSRLQDIFNNNTAEESNIKLLDKQT